MKEEDIQTAARILLGSALVFAGISHLTFARKAFRAQVPDWVPLKTDDTVVYSGIAEILLGSSLALCPAGSEKTVGKIAASFFVMVFPGKLSPIYS